ncbi:SGNH/GDSL hydrolase family protein [Kribbella sp. NBC_00382]|uniref:SGNH/GDSL hydrolase family protein n=1 Tax=Kribbella sp. NBC_00382 TaxID=2975967 RepID=UPI002E2177D4
MKENTITTPDLLTATTSDQLEWDWHQPAGPEGKGWSDTERLYHRLPGRARGVVPDSVWDLSTYPSSLLVRFRTDATRIAARWTVGLPELGKWHMPPTAVSGLDLYGRDDAGRIRWVGISPSISYPTTVGPIVDGLDGAVREYLVYLPLFNTLESLEIGVGPGARFEVLPAPNDRPIVYYGTSVIHGAAASRAGMTVPAQLGRRLGRTVVGLGFSGSGKMEIELAQLIAEIDAAVYLVDCLPNMNADQVTERALPFIRELRSRRPDVPVLLIEDRTYANAWARPAMQNHHRASRAALAEAHRAASDPGVHYVTGGQLLGEDGDDTVDGSHPTDLGFARISETLTPILERLLGR